MKLVVGRGIKIATKLTIKPSTISFWDFVPAGENLVGLEEDFMYLITEDGKYLLLS